MGLLVGAHFYLQKRERVAWLFAGPPPVPTAEDHGVILKDVDRMVIPVEVELKCLVEQQRDYPWPKPGRCPRCEQCRVWGHGFVAAFFDGIPATVYLKRFRCPVSTNLFDDTAVSAIHQGSGGLLRQANHLARGALITAAKLNTTLVSAEHVRLAPTELLDVNRR
jgi:hypothetical protein